MPEKNVNQEIAELEQRLATLRQRQKELETMTPEKRLAVELHRIMCHWNHTDGCGWYYEVSGYNTPQETHNWETGSTHADYLKKAQRAIALLPNVPVDTILDVASALKN